MFRYGISITLFVLIGCATTRPRPPQAAPSPLIVSDALLEAHKGDLDGLYRAWLLPFATKENIDYIPFASKDKLNAGADAIRDGFNRFCAAGGGVVSFSKSPRFGTEYRCAGPEGAFAGLISVGRIEDNVLYVTYDSPKRVEARASRQRAFDKRKAQNGPTGWIVTDEGKVRFLRLGTLAERHVIEVEMDASGESVPIEDIARIDFHATCCDIDVKLRDGRTRTLNQAGLRYLDSPNVSTSYGVGRYGLPVVVVDPASGQPYTRIFSNIEGVRAIEPDADAASWSALPGGLMKTTIEVASQSNVERYTQQLRKRAKQLYADATSNGSIKLLPDGKLTPDLSRHLESELRGLTRDPDCEGDVTKGVMSLDGVARCRVAARELKLISAGYSLVTDVTPLSTIIVFEKINRDLR
jgi:hypothetical protein